MARNKTVPFVKMTGGGNDFVVLDNRDGSLGGDYARIAQKLCERKFSIGADGLLVMEKCGEADFRMVYFNADGSRAEMCGNGARCISRFAHLQKAAAEKMTFLTDVGILSSEIKADSVKLKMGEPRDLKLDFTVALSDNRMLALSSVNTGVPHAVLLVTDLERTEVQELGKAIRTHKDFAPAGTNANFVLPQDKHTLAVRTYERGVEGETLACGTGVTASALICAAKGLVESPVSCRTRGGDVLKIYYQMKNQTFSDVYLEGPAIVCFKGEVEI